MSINLDSGPLIYTCITIIYDTIKLPKIKGFNVTIFVVFEKREDF